MTKLHCYHHSQLVDRPQVAGFCQSGLQTISNPTHIVTTVQQMHRSSCTLIIITTGFVIGFMPRAHFARWNITSTTDTIHCRGSAALAIEIIAIFITIIIQGFNCFKIHHHWNIHILFLYPFTSLTFGNGTQKNMILYKPLGSWIDWIASDNWS